MKLLKYILNIIVWSVLGLYLLFFLALQIPTVQEYLGHKLASVAAEKLGTDVSIGRADIGIPNRLTLYDVLILDQQGKEMLKARRLSARVNWLEMTDGRISIATAQLFGAHATFYQRDSLSKANYQFALDSLASKDTTDTNPIDLRINSLIMRHSSVKYDRYDQAETPEKFNAKHLNFSYISAHIILKKLSKDSLNVNIKRLSFNEKSGLKLDRLSMKFVGGRSHSLLTDFALKMPGTEILLGDIKASYSFQGDHFFLPSLNYSGTIEPSNVTLSDLMYFLPSLKTFNSSISFSSSFHGRGEDLDIPDLQVHSTTGDIDISASGWVKDLTQRSPTWIADINDLRLSDKTINFISENLRGQQVEVPPVVTRLGNIHMKGFVKGTGTESLVTSSELHTDAGAVAVTMVIDKQRKFNSKINADAINLSHLLDDGRFGKLSTNIDLSGQLPGAGHTTIHADGNIKEFGFNNYTYHDITLNGTYDNTGLRGALNVDDPHLKLTAEGLMEQIGSMKNLNLTAAVSNFSPQAIHLSDEWGNAVFTTQLTTNIHGSSLDDAEGTIDLTDFSMQSTEDSYQLDSLHFESGFEGQQRHIILHSDFADLSVNGTFKVEDLPHSFTNFLVEELPTLPGLPAKKAQTQNNISVNATVYKSDFLEHLLGIPLKLTKPLELRGMVNDNTRQMDIECNCPQFFYKDSQYDHARLHIMSPLGTLLYNLTVSKLMGDGDIMELQMEGGAHNNKLTSTLLFSNSGQDHMAGKITAMADFDQTVDGQKAIHVNIASSKLNVRDTEWTIHPCHITYSNHHLDIDDFAIQHGDQHLQLNGSASESSQDQLTVNLRGIEISYILDLVDFHAVEFSGLATGKGSVSGVFGDVEASAKLQVEQFKFENGRMGTLNADVNWNTEKKQIDIHAIADDGPEAKTYIDGYVSPAPGPGYIDLGIRADGTYLDFAHSFTSSFISHIDGHGNGHARVIGPLDAINLTGQLVLNGRAHVKTLGCTYEMRNDTIRMIPNEIEFMQCPIYDIRGNKGILTGGIHHKELTNLTYDIFVDANNIMAYDFPDFGDELFYGTVYARGTAAIHGRDDEVLIEADVTPVESSFLVYNAATPDAITNTEFIQWGTQSSLNTQNSFNIPYSQNTFPTDYRSDLTMRLKVNATPNSTIRLLMDANTGDYITLHGNGELQATYYNKGSFTMFGNYEVTDGTYNVTIQNIIKKDFTFKEGGTIVFGGDPYDAQLDLQAQHVVNGVSLSDLNVGQSFSNTVRVNCLMNITGQPREPLVDFDLDILNVNSDEKQMVRSVINGQEEMRQQVVYLLAVGRFYPQGANNASQSENDRNNTSLAMQSLLSGTLSGQINNMLGQVINSNNWNFGANISTGDEGWNNAEYEGIINGRLLNNRLLINGQFGYRDNATTATPSFIGDFDISYLLYPSGNLALKVYNQSNDRYFTRSSLNTQGIGLIMKKDFDGWRELFTTRKKKKK